MHVDRPRELPAEGPRVALLGAYTRRTLLRLLVVDATPGAEKDAFVGARRDPAALTVVSFVRRWLFSRRSSSCSPQKTVVASAWDVARA